jgi:hypothetical protein
LSTLQLLHMLIMCVYMSWRDISSAFKKKAYIKGELCIQIIKSSIFSIKCKLWLGCQQLPKGGDCKCNQSPKWVSVMLTT